jgi:hypothetical protein
MSHFVSCQSLIWSFVVHLIQIVSKNEVRDLSGHKKDDQTRVVAGSIANALPFMVVIMSLGNLPSKKYLSNLT